MTQGVLRTSRANARRLKIMIDAMLFTSRGAFVTGLVAVAYWLM
jgi:hypothetical protein